MTDATNTADVDPDRASVTVALNAARDLLLQAAGVIAGTVIDLAGKIGQLVLANLLPRPPCPMTAATTAPGSPR